jgi:hypothetical protein
MASSMCNVVVTSIGTCLVAIVLMAAGCGKDAASVTPADPRIVGVWTLVGGDYPLTNEYRADGTVVQHLSGRTTDPVPFRIEGKFLICSVKQPDGTTFEQKDEFTLTGDTLTFIDAPTVRRVFRRNKRG